MSHEGSVSAAEPLDLRELFARPWSGRVSLWRPWWLRWLPLASPVHFRTEIADAHLAETTGLIVRDTMTFSNGKLWERTMTAQLVGPGRWRVSAEDMPGGAEQTVGPDGFAFTPFTILAPVLGPLRVPLRCTDEIVLLDARTMVDTSEMRFLGVRVGKMEMRLEQN
ncbi:MAG: DUF3833 family protein [Marmoricola sp.]